MTRCARCEELDTEVKTVLEKISKLTTSQVEAFRSNDWPTLMRLDKELENAIGEKERSFGKHREHEESHKLEPR